MGQPGNYVEVMQSAACCGWPRRIEKSLAPLGARLAVLFGHTCHGRRRELGTDGWIQNITGNILTSGEGKILSSSLQRRSLMFLLRFCGDFIEKKDPALVDPVGHFAGLFDSGMHRPQHDELRRVVWFCHGRSHGRWNRQDVLLANDAGLEEASDRFPRTGAIAIRLWVTSACEQRGLLTGPSRVGRYSEDRPYAGEEVQKVSQTLYDQYKAEKPSQFLVFPPATGLDGKKLGEVKAAIAAGTATEEQKTVQAADIRGALRHAGRGLDDPATMAVIYLGLLADFAFRSAATKRCTSSKPAACPRRRAIRPWSAARLPPELRWDAAGKHCGGGSMARWPAGGRRREVAPTRNIICPSGQCCRCQR